MIPPAFHQPSTSLPPGCVFHLPITHRGGGTPPGAGSLGCPPPPARATSRRSQASKERSGKNGVRASPHATAPLMAQLWLGGCAHAGRGATDFRQGSPRKAPFRTIWRASGNFLWAVNVWVSGGRAAIGEGSRSRADRWPEAGIDRDYSLIS
jgi:hypothetical protein